MGCPGGHEHDPRYTHSALGALFWPIFLYVFLEKDCNRRKMMVVRCFDVIMITCFPKKCTGKFSFCPKSALKC